MFVYVPSIFILTLTLLLGNNGDEFTIVFFFIKLAQNTVQQYI